jgi:hypothetical protein
MKIRLELEDNITEDEIVIHCRELTDEIIALQRQIAEAVHTGMQLHVIRAKLPIF